MTRPTTPSSKDHRTCARPTPSAFQLSKMPAAVLPPPKRVLADSTKAHRNTNPTVPSTNTAKRRKLENGSSPSKRLKVSQNGKGPTSSQPKSQFETETLEKLTQDITGLKENNSEKDQQWERPGLGDFDEKRDALVFQQIEAEEGTLHGGKTTVKLFGVTEVSCMKLGIPDIADSVAARRATLFSFMSPTSYITFTLPLRFRLQRQTQRVSRYTSRRSSRSINPLYILYRW